MKQDILGLRNVPKETIEKILSTAAEMKEKMQKQMGKNTQK